MSFAVILGRLRQYPLAVVSVVLSIVFVILIFVRGGVGEELSAQETELKSRLRTINQNVRHSSNLEQEVEDLGIMVEQIGSRLFDRSERAININFFYGFEERVDVVISSITQQPNADAIYEKGGPRELKLHSTLVFDISIDGTFENILLFCHELHRVDPLIRVADLRVTGKKVGGDLLSARLRTLVLSKKD